jgi:hypothetical protein
MMKLDQVTAIKVANFKSNKSKIPMPLINLELVHNHYSQSLKRYFDTLSCANKETI